MKLHLDRVAFEQIIDEVASENGIRHDILEKDYYVSLLLKELSSLENQCFAYFKGGTALYKALRSIRRFSEDIDLTVFVDDCPTASQAKKRLEKATLKYTSLVRGDVLENRKGSITCEYLYESMYELDLADSLQRFGKVKVEATSFTVSEPTTKIEIAPHLYELCSDERKAILKEYYDVSPFEIETISLERIFVDKVFATQFYFERKLFADVSKHVYDITIMLQNERIRAFLQDKEHFKRIVLLKRREETFRQGGVDENLDIKDFPYFHQLRNASEFIVEFSKMQKIYVFNEKDKIEVDIALESLNLLRAILLETLS